MANAITIAVREGTSADPETNVRLRLLVDKARSVNMPKANIERAIERALHHVESQSLKSVVYEGFAPGGIAVIVEGVTDNTQRTYQEIKNAFHTKRGILGQTGSVSYLFDQVGEIHIGKSGKSEEDIISLALELGIDDVEEESDRFVLYTKPHDLASVRHKLLEKGYTVMESELIYRPKLKVSVTESNSEKVVDLLKFLSDLSDIHKVYTNADL